MEEIFKIVGPIGLIAAIAAAVTAVICHIVAMQLSQQREELRVLRVALERDPSPGQLAQAVRMWPEVGKYSPNMQKAELVKKAHEEEIKRAQKTESIKGLVRTMFFVAAFALALYVASIFIARNAAAQGATPTTTTETPATN